ncbi:putative leader peptide [Streptomyces sp. NPDC058171]
MSTGRRGCGHRPSGRGRTPEQACSGRLPGARGGCSQGERPPRDTRLTTSRHRGVLRNVTDTDVRLWRRVHMDLVRYAGCVCRWS